MPVSVSELHEIDRWFPAANPWVWAAERGLWDGEDVAATALVFALAETTADHREDVDPVLNALHVTSPDAALLLEALAGSPERLALVIDGAPAHVRTAVAARRDVPDPVASVLALDPDADVVCALVRNPAVDELLVHGAALTHQDDLVQRAYEERFPRPRLATRTRRPQATPAVVQPPIPLPGSGFDPDYRGRLSVELTREALGECSWRPSVRPADVSEDVVADVLRRTDDVDVLRRTTVRAHDRFRAAAAENPALPPELLAQVCVDPSTDVRLVALRNPALPEDLARLALADAVELEERDPDSEPAAEILLALADNPGLPSALLVELAGRQLSGAAYTLLVDRPGEAWADLGTEALFDALCTGHHVELLTAIPLSRFRWPVRMLLLEAELCRPEDLLELHDEDPWDDGAWEELADRLLDAHGPTEFWTYAHSDGDLPARVAADDRCTAALADRLLHEHRQHAPTLRAIAAHSALSLPVRHEALYSWLEGDEVVGDLAEDVRAWALGHALLTHPGSWPERVRLAVELDAREDGVLTALGRCSAGALVADAAGQATST